MTHCAMLQGPATDERGARSGAVPVPCLLGVRVGCPADHRWARAPSGQPAGHRGRVYRGAAQTQVR